MQRRLMWISGAVLAIGIAVFLGVYLSSRGTSQAAQVSTLGSKGPTSTTSATKNPKVAAAPAALQVARTFLETAVQRKNLDAAYKIVGPDLRGGMSLAQWRKGNIAVAFYPARNAKTTSLIVKESRKNDLFLQVVLNPRKGSGVRTLAFTLGVHRVAGKKWVVNYWIPDPTYRVKATPGN